MIKTSFVAKRSVVSLGGGFIRRLFVVAVAGMIGLATSQAFAVVVSDNFSDGTDGAPGSPANVSGPVWSHLDGLALSSGQVWDASSGAYHMTAFTDGFSGYGLVGSYVPTTFTDVRITTDVLSFSGAGANPAISLLARSNGGNDFYTDPNALRGYGWVYEPYSNTTGEMVFYKFTTPEEGVFKDIGSKPVNLDPSKDYQFVLEIIGTQLHGQVFEIGGGLVLDNTTIDSSFASGYSGVLSIGRAGVTAAPDWTIDNFRSEDVVSLVGDYNGNGKVDAADYVLWRDNPAGFGGSPAGYDAWRTNYGNPPGSGAGLGAGSAIPEPLSGLLMLLGTVYLSFTAGRPRR